MSPARTHLKGNAPTHPRQVAFRCQLASGTSSRTKARSRVICKQTSILQYTNTGDVLTPCACIAPGCRTRPWFGIPTGKPLHCAKHRVIGEQNLVHGNWCIFPECHKMPLFGMPDDKPMHCSQHKLAGEQDLVNKTQCTFEGCRKRSLFGTLEGKPVHCAQHKLKLEEDVVSRICIAPGCCAKPLFGTQWSKPIHCLKHKLSSEQDVTRLCLKTRRYGSLRNRAIGDDPLTNPIKPNKGNDGRPDLLAASRRPLSYTSNKATGNVDLFMKSAKGDKTATCSGQVDLHVPHKKSMDFGARQQSFADKPRCNQGPKGKRCMAVVELEIFF